MLIFRAFRSAEVQEFTKVFHKVPTLDFSNQLTTKKVRSLIKCGYYIVPDPSTTLLTGEKRTQGQSERPRG